MSFASATFSLPPGNMPAVQRPPRCVRLLSGPEVNEAVVVVARHRSRALARRDPLANRCRVEAGEKLTDLPVVLGLINHLAQTTDPEPPPLAALHHIIEVVQSARGTLFDPLAVESANGDAAVAGIGAPVSPPLEGEAVLVVPAAIALLLWFAGTDPDGPSADDGVQGGEGTVNGRAVGKSTKQ